MAAILSGNCLRGAHLLAKKFLGCLCVSVDGHSLSADNVSILITVFARSTASEGSASHVGEVRRKAEESRGRRGAGRGSLETTFQDLRLKVVTADGNFEEYDSWSGGV
jgi:hypothetical protein